MRISLMERAFFALLIAFFIPALNLTPKLSGQHSPLHPTSVTDLFNQEAAASDPAGIHKYSADLIDLLVPPGVSDETRQGVIDALAGRLRRTEEAAKVGRGKPIPEANVVRAYNELMGGIGAPASFRTTEEPVRQFREYAVSFKAFPALFSADRNGTNCNPGEAVYLLYLLLWDNGKPSEEDLYSAWVKQQPSDQRQVPPRPNDQGSRGEEGYAVGRAQWLIYRYSLGHKPDATIALFKNAADTLGF